MKNKNSVLKLLTENNGVFTSSQAQAIGIDNKTLQRLHHSGEIVRLDHGIYMDPNKLEDQYLVTHFRCKKGIFSHETALYFHGLTDRTPMQLTLTVPSGYNTRLLKDKDQYKFFYIAEGLHAIGEIMLVSPFGNEIPVYDKERTICDCLKKKDLLDTDLVIEAVKLYMKSPGSDYAKLLKYAEIFKIRDSVRQYMEVLT
jgi:predicted transcriptional regulator of viral defense system